LEITEEPVEGMAIKILPVDFSEKEILRNLLEKYDYEFSQYDQRDINSLGLFGYKYLDYYWTEERRWAFFIQVEGKLAGFAMVNDFPETQEVIDYAMAEFFVLFKYRGQGVGKYVAHQLFERFPGRWQLKLHPKNTASVSFWDSVIDSFTKGNYRLEKAHPLAEYEDGTLGDVYFWGSARNLM